MQSYRLVPVGDKIVLIFESSLPELPTESAADCIEMLNGDAGCYDFGIDGAGENESFNEVATWPGGYSRE
jgi:hypothetical protein